MMKKVVSLITALFLVLLIGVVPVSAHVQNEKNLYSDIEYSEALQEIVLLHGIRAIGIEGGVNLFKPFEMLTRSDLAFWAGRFHGLGGTGAAADAIRQAALEAGLVPSLDGYATYGDVNQAYFGGAAPVEDEEATMTREEFALYMGQFFTEPVDGKTLFDMANYEAGPTGIVEEVDKVTVTEGGNTYDVFRIAIGGEWYQVSHHPKILNGPVDLTQWIDKMVEASWYAPASSEDAERELDIIKVGEAQFTDEEIGAIPDTEAGHSHEEEDIAAGEAKEDADGAEDTGEAQEVSAPVDTSLQPPQSTAKEAEKDGGRSLPIVLIIGGVLLVLIILWLILRRRK